MQADPSTGLIFPGEAGSWEGVGGGAYASIYGSTREDFSTFIMYPSWRYQMMAYASRLRSYVLLCGVSCLG